MAIDHLHIKAGGAQLGGRDLGRLLWAHPAGLPIAIAIEYGADRRQVIVHEKIDAFPDLAFPTFAVANEAENALVQTIQAGRQCQAVGNRQALPQ